MTWRGIKHKPPILVVTCVDYYAIDVDRRLLPEIIINRSPVMGILENVPCPSALFSPLSTKVN